MHAALTTTWGSTEEQDLVAVAAIAGEEMQRWLRELEGFCGLVVLSNRETGTTQVISFWDSQEVAESHRASRLQLRDRVTSTVGVEVLETQSYEVSFADFPRDKPQDEASNRGG
jgi:heme-degrading monooxygenase HmoA